MGGIEAWVPGIAHPSIAPHMAARAEDAGWDGMVVVDSQNLSGDPYVALALAAGATERLKLGTGVTNPVTRHPAATAAAILSVHAISGGRAVLGIGRGDSALAHVGLAPASVDHLDAYVQAVRAYLRGESVTFDALTPYAPESSRPLETLGLAGAPDASHLSWRPGDLEPVPVEVAATGPRVLDVAARTADRVLLAVGADVERVQWAIDVVRSARTAAGLDPDGVAIGAFVNVGVHDDRATARSVVAGGLSTFARFSVMHGSVPTPVDDDTRAVLTDVHRAYDMTRHTQAGSPQTAPLTDTFIDRFGIVGPAAECTARLLELAGLGIDRFIVVGPTIGVDPIEAGAAVRRFADGVLPALHEG